MLLPAANIDAQNIAVCFPVLKTGGLFPAESVDRQNLDRRRWNAREKRIVSGSRFVFEAAPRVVDAGDDLRNFYHLFTGSDQRAATTAVGPSFVAGDLCGWSAYDPSWPDHERIR